MSTTVYRSQSYVPPTHRWIDQAEPDTAEVHTVYHSHALPSEIEALMNVDMSRDLGGALFRSGRHTRPGERFRLFFIATVRLLGLLLLLAAVVALRQADVQLTTETLVALIALVVAGMCLPGMLAGAGVTDA